MRALLAAPLLLLLACVPAVAADDPPLPSEIAPRMPDPDPFCLFRPVIPETPLYYILWHCTAGQVGVPEPIHYATGCHLGFPAYRIYCHWDEGRVTGPVIDCIRECVYINPPCVEPC
jgi:hypothetical protein